MIFKLCSILLASASLLGSAVGAPVEASDGMIHEYITRADGTVDHFAYHSSFIGDSDLDGNLTTVGVINNPSNALKQRNIFGKQSFQQRQLGTPRPLPACRFSRIMIKSSCVKISIF